MKVFLSDTVQEIVSTGRPAEHGCQMVSFQTKKSQFGKILEGLRLKKC
jgi:hypothetical protein